jgi:hypothetical protein
MFKHFQYFAFLSLFVVSVHATDTNSPEISGNLSSANMEIMNVFQKENTRGEWFTSYYTARDFCRNNRTQCNRLGYSTARRQWYAIDYYPYNVWAY